MAWAFRNGLIFRQLFDRVSCGYTYLLGDEVSKSALLIDPILELVDRDLTLINEIGLKLKYAINTHVHADHVTGSGEIKKRLNKNETQVLSVLSKSSGGKADILFDDKDLIKCGSITLNALYTPGHTNGCSCFVEHSHKMVFTGDTLLIRGCGRTDFKTGSSSKLYDSIHNCLFTLPENYIIFPAHDYKGQTQTTIGEEKRFNPRLIQSKEKFINIMDNLNLDLPKMFDIALPKNLICGL